MVIANLGTPAERAERHRQPQHRPAHGLPAPGVLGARGAQALAGRARRARPRDPRRASSPASRRSSTPAGSSPASSPTATRRPSCSRSASDNLDELDVQAKAVADVARTVPGLRDVRVSLQIDYPEIRVETDREKAGLVGVTSRRRGGDHAGRHARQHQHARACGSTPPTASRTTSSPPTTARRSPTRRRSPQLPVRVGAAGRRSRSAPTARSGREPRARSPSSATSSSARRTCSCRPRGATSAAPPRTLDAALRKDPRTRDIKVELRRAGAAHAHDVLAGSAWRSASR